MEAGTQASFIPHEADVAPQDSAWSNTSGLADLFSLFALVLLVASVALAVGVFLYQQLLSVQSSSKVEDLSRAKSAFEPSLIRELTRLDDRMHAADSILAAHIAPSILFATLNQATLSTVSFASLSFDASDPQHPTIAMEGVARSVNSVALQDDIFSKNGVIASPVFSGIRRQPEGVRFSLKALVNPAALNYRGSQAAASATGGQQSAPQSPFGGGVPQSPPSGQPATTSPQ